MFKTGICDRESLARTRSSRGRPKIVSYRLLKYDEDPSADATVAFEEVIRGARLAGGVYRTTYRGRMADVDADVEALLEASFPRETPLDVQDWAASDCLASCEWAERLFDRYPRCRVIASDQSFFLVEAANDAKEAYIFEESGAPLQYVRAPFVIDLNASLSPVYVVNRWLLRRARRRLEEAAAITAKAKWENLIDRRPFEFPPWRIERIPLLHPAAIRLLNSGAAFGLKRHSVFTPLSVPVAVIRTMNILNRAYFTSERLRSGIRAVFDSLSEGGFWIVGRTVEEVTPPENHVTVWQKTGNAFHERLRIGTGSEIADLVHEFHGP